MNWYIGADKVAIKPDQGPTITKLQSVQFNDDRRHY